MENKNYKEKNAELSEGNLDRASGGKNRNYNKYAECGIIVEDHWCGDKCFVRTRTGGKGTQIDRSLADKLVEKGLHVS